MTCGECFQGPSANAPMTLWEPAHGRVLTHKGEVFTPQWPPLLGRSVWRRRSVFLSPGPLVFIMYLLFPVYFSLSGDVRTSMCSSLPWLYKCVLMAVRRDRLCIVLGCAACQLSWMALTEVFLRPLSFTDATRAVCEVFGSRVKPYTDKTINSGHTQQVISQQCTRPDEPWRLPPKNVEQS